MRNEFANQILDCFKNDSNLFFLTGDLGFGALEKIKESYPNRFINSGVAEQNMIGVAAGLANSNHPSFVYSIAPFVVFRCLEQIRVDVCLHDLPVYIVGNGGGYGYGIMGATHHAIEDLACLSPMQNLVCWIPSFSSDVSFCVQSILSRKKPAYLRLGIGIDYPSPITISFINSILKCNKPSLTIIVQGPIVKNVVQAVKDFENIDLFTVLTLPIIENNEDILNSIRDSRKVLVIEEHVKRGGFGEYFLAFLYEQNISIDNFVSLHAKGYPSKTYGSQSFHQTESGLDVEAIYKSISNILL